MNQRIAKAIHELYDAIGEHLKTRKRGEMDFNEIECMKIHRACGRMLFWAKRNKGD